VHHSPPTNRPVGFDTEVGSSSRSVDPSPPVERPLHTVGVLRGGSSGSVDHVDPPPIFMSTSWHESSPGHDGGLAVTLTSASDVDYDPYDIDADPSAETRPPFVP
jgi:hypothetical protein